MGFRRVIVSRPSQLPLAMDKLSKALDKGVRGAFVRTARFGHTAVVRTMSITNPKPEASYTYRNSWVVKKTRGGAILGNSALASYFVEVGRRPGKMPPFSSETEGILPWVRLKRFSFDASGQIKKKKPGKKSGKKKTPAQSKVASKRQGKGIKQPKAPRGKKKDEAQRRFARLVALKIAKKGTPGRYVLLRTMPKIQKRAKREIKKSLRAVSAKGGKP